MIIFFKYTIKLKMSKYLSVIIFAIFLSLKSNSQIKKTEVIGSYIYNFAKHTNLKKCKQSNTYNIVLISDNEDLTKEFKINTYKKKIKNKQILVSSYSIVKPELVNACLIFVSKEKSNLFPKILNITNNKNILLVTEDYYDKRKIMLNLLETKDGKMTFEYNKANLFKEGISISDELLLYGGSEVDNIEFYLQTKKDLKKAESKLSILNSEISKIKQQAEKINQKTIQQKKQIESIKKEKLNLISEIEKYKNEVDNNKTEVKKIKNRLKTETLKLTALSDSLINSKKSLNNQKKQLEEGYIKLLNLKDEIRKRNNEIKVQELSLGEQYDKIKRQRKTNTLFIVIIILGTILLVGLFLGFLYRKKKNDILKRQKEEISNKNLMIKDNLEKKRMINELLKDKNEELKNIIEQLKQTQQQLIQSEKMASLGTLTAGIAHEINNPINFVYAGVNSLKKDFDDIEVVINKLNELNPDSNNLKEKILEIEKLKEEYYFDEAFEAIPEIISGIKEGASRTAEIVDGLRTFARMDGDKLIRVNINESIDASLLILKNKFKNIIKIKRNYENIPEVLCNPGKISQVIINVLANAIDALLETKKENKKIIINTTFNKSNVKLSIEDNGPGIPDDIKVKIFDPFFTTKEIGKGTGLGLSISYNIIKEHKGKMEVITEEGKGTKFIIILPLK